MKKFLFFIVWATVLHLFASTITFGEESNRLSGQKRTEKTPTEGRKDLPALDALPLQLEIISWVEVSFQGGLLKRHKEGFEALIRSRLRHELPMLSHEVKPIHVVRKELLESGFAPELAEKELKKRGCVNCLVWTTGDDNLVVFLTECQLAGYGDYRNRKHSAFESRILDFGSTLSAKRQVESALTNIVHRISTKFLGAGVHLKSLY